MLINETIKDVQSGLELITVGSNTNNNQALIVKNSIFKNIYNPVFNLLLSSADGV